MAANPIPTTLNALMALAEDAADGAHTHQDDIGLKQNREADLRADIADLEAKIAICAARVGAKPGLSSDVRVSDSNGKAFIATARDILIPVLDAQWSQLWEPTGFPNQSLGVPRTQPERQTLLASLRDYFTANPTHENAPLGITAANATARFTALSNARSASNQGLTETGLSLVARNNSAKKLTKRLRGLVNELGQILEDDDPRWLAFGFNMPGSSESPDPAEGLVVTPGSDGEAFADWNDAARALRYHVEIQIMGVDADFRRVKTVNDSDATLTELPVGPTIRVRVISVNDAGSAPPSDVVEVVLA